MSIKTKQGFTLIELIIVIGIIGLLVGISVSFLGNARSRGIDAGKISVLSEVRSALNIYFNDTAGGNGAYPAGNATALKTALVPKYISDIDPNIKYQSTNIINTAVCASNCLSYQLAISLLMTDNHVLKIDKDLSVPDGIYGTKDNCSSGTASTPDLCYDITP